MVVVEYVSLFVDDETRSLSFLRHQPVEEVERDCLGRNVYHRTIILAIDGNVVLLFRIKCIAASRLADLDVARMSDPVGQPDPARTISREIEKPASENNGEQDRSKQLHSFRNLPDPHSLY